jgi:hypothetical protein
VYPKTRKGRLRNITDITYAILSRDADITEKDTASGEVTANKIGFQKIPEEIKTEKKKFVKGKPIKSKINCGQKENVDLRKPKEENDSQEAIE